MSIESKWANLRPAQKRNVMLAVAGTLVSGVFIAYASSAPKSAPDKRSAAAAKPEVTLLMGRDTKDVSTEVLQARLANMESELSQLARKLAAVDGNQANKGASPSADTVLPYEGGSDLVTLPGTPIVKNDRNQPGKNASPNIPSTPIKPLNPRELTTPTSQLTPMPYASPLGENKPAVVDLSPIPDLKDDKPYSDQAQTVSAESPTKSGPSQSRIRGFMSTSQPLVPPAPEGEGANDPTVVAANTSKNGLPMTQRERINQSIQRNNQASKQTEKKDTYYIPPGTMLSGVLVTGADVPTGPNSKSEPLPVLFRIKDLAIMPNFALLDIRECFILVSTYGDLSSERAHMRTETLSCVTNDNKIIDSKIDAFASGEDGKAGIRGRLVSKAGSVIAKGALAAFIEGMSNIFQPSRVRALSINPSNTEQFQMPDPEFAVTQGAFAGARSTANQIKDYYMKTADSIFPIIEIDAGRSMDFIVHRGASITPKSQGEITSSAAGNTGLMGGNAPNKVNNLSPKNMGAAAMGAVTSGMFNGR
ncbi:MAG: TrbI/VirB10 family protein [Methylophilus sp.]|uniref:TraB/VirB10 family protein n=1 Tax=Methylophilus sp. TaxID=29541 RepID=UPI003FA13E63